MGVCKSKNMEPGPEGERNKKISKEVTSELIKANTAEKKTNKLLLLGAGGSGKSTLFKQMVVLYGEGFPECDHINFTPVVYTNIIQSMRIMCEESEKYGPVAENRKNDKEMIMALPDETKINSTIGTAIQNLWKDPGIQKTYNNRYSYELKDSTRFFLDSIERVMKDDYLPSKEDMLRARISTTGIVEQTFIMDNNVFKMFDVGGQRSERKKWIHCFENVTAVLFVAAISAYNQVLYEDESSNRMTEALDLFDEISNSEWFSETSMILFLNKKDIFNQKIQMVPLKKYFPEFTGEEKNQEHAQQFITEMFENRNQQDQTIYTHVTCATDSQNVKIVFIAVKDIVIRAGLARAGLA